MSVRDILAEGARELGIDLTDTELSLFMLYLDQLKLWSAKINLTAVKTDRDIVIKHFIDSIVPAEYIEENAALLDIGSGGGFPGVPLKIVRPDLQVTLLESSGKKVSFLKDLIRKLGLSGLNALAARAEDAQNAVPRHSFDCVITRAVGSVPYVLELSLPYVKKEGMIVLMRGRTGAEDFEGSELEGKLELMEDRRMTLPYDSMERRLLIFKPEVS